MPLAPDPTPALAIQPRQLWAYPSMTSSLTQSCGPITLAAGGVLTLNPTETVTFTTHVTYQPNCLATDSYFNNTDAVAELNSDPFYASTTVLIYVVATTTAIAWFLLTTLFLAPGRYSPNAPARNTGWLAGRSLSGMMSNKPSILSTGSRPWLQKAAAFLVTIALTIASADTFAVAQDQYRTGRLNATDMRDQVVGSWAIRIMRVISDVFIWLAQVQTLIRLFPRRKEKLIIKWFGFLLILLDTVFSCLNSFYSNSRALPRVNQDAIPALSYLFQLSISLLYGAWVFYYVATKRRYAFFTTEMPSIAIVSVLAIVSILIPVGFFVADVSVPAVAGWGDFFRWVGAAAASVLVWEWVERIEFLEREERRDGILGREIFEEDESTIAGSTSKKIVNDFNSATSEGGGGTSKVKLGAVLADAYLRTSRTARQKFGIREVDSRRERATNEKQSDDAHRKSAHQPPVSNDFTPVVPSDTPVSRTDTDTPSTVYAVHYHPITETPPIANETQQTSTQPQQDTRHNSLVQTQGVSGSTAQILDKQASTIPGRSAQAKWQFTQQIFKRGKKSPPLEIKQAMSLNAQVHEQLEHDGARHIIRHKLGRFAGMGGVVAKDVNTGSSEQPTVIPAPPRGQAWSPDIMRHSPVQPRGRNTEAQDQDPHGTSEEHPGPPEGESASRSTMDVTDATLVESSSSLDSAEELMVDNGRRADG